MQGFPFLCLCHGGKLRPEEVKRSVEVQAGSHVLLVIHLGDPASLENAAQSVPGCHRDLQINIKDRTSPQFTPDRGGLTLVGEI